MTEICKYKHTMVLHHIQITEEARVVCDVVIAQQECSLIKRFYVLSKAITKKC